MTRLVAPTMAALLHICRNLRARDREEIFATRFDEDPVGLAEETYALREFGWVAVASDGEPVAVIGAAPIWPTVWSVYAFGTDRWPEVVRTLTKHARRFMMPALLNTGARRAQCYALYEHDDARHWLKALGANEEHVLEEFGKSGERFVLYAWDRKEMLDVLRHAKHGLPARRRPSQLSGAVPAGDDHPADAPGGDA